MMRRGAYLCMVAQKGDVSDLVWKVSEIRDSTAKLNHIILGYGAVRKRSDGTKWVKYTGYKYLYEFVGGDTFVEKILDGTVRAELDSSEGHCHGPKFRPPLKHLGELWKAIDTYGDCAPTRRRDDVETGAHMPTARQQTLAEMHARKAARRSKK
jgi:hypothetical protein